MTAFPKYPDHPSLLRRVFYVLILLVAASFMLPCSTPRANNADELCARIDENSTLDIVTPEAAERIRDDIVAGFHRSLVENYAKNVGADPDTHGPILQLVKEHMLGAWREGAHLHLAEGIGPIDPDDDELGVRWRERIRRLVKLRETDEASQRCLRLSVRLLFEDITLHVNSERTERFSLKGDID